LGLYFVDNLTVVIGGKSTSVFYHYEICIYLY
jgi:hypothetical protein